VPMGLWNYAEVPAALTEAAEDSIIVAMGNL
jgi:hypothetical protein